MAHLLRDLFLTSTSNATCRHGVFVCTACGNELLQGFVVLSSSSVPSSIKPMGDQESSFGDPVHRDSLLKTILPGSTLAYAISCGRCKNPVGYEFPAREPKYQNMRDDCLRFVPKKCGIPWSFILG